MSLIVPEGLPAVSALLAENISVNTGDVHSVKAENKPIRIVILNLMPMKIETENDLLRMLSYSSATIEVSFMKLRSHVSKHTAAGHLAAFYQDAAELMAQRFDGMIVTGAPVETIGYEEVDYWNELVGVFNWARANVRSTLYLCWGAMAALYHFYGIPKHLLPTKRFGVFDTVPSDATLPVFRGFDDTFRMPHSRHTEIRRADIERVGGIDIIAESDEAGLCITSSRNGGEFYVLGHLEYPAWTLDNEYHRDLGKRDDVDIPQHYYPDDNPSNKPKATWRSAATLFYNNWIKYYVCP